ncbi:YjdF family protein [Heyndrickxia sp. FSL W8-0496]|uniref:YjdF family protein n=1 Tax=Heyndrickxia TaxID=2837504 RepID=UPI0030FCF2A6
MKLTIYYDGQFYVGLVETVSNHHLKAYRYIFGNDPKDHEVLDFIYQDLPRLIANQQQKGIPVEKKSLKKINPKRLQRMVSKELKQIGTSPKAQDAIKEEYTQRKKEKIIRNKQLKEEQKELKRKLKIQKKKNKHKGR